MDKLSKDEVKKLGALGYRDEMTEEELAHKVVCGVTGLVFENDEAYDNHVSPVTGFTPRDIEHQDALTGGQASQVAQAALARGEARKGDEEVDV